MGCVAVLNVRRANRWQFRKTLAPVPLSTGSGVIGRAGFAATMNNTDSTLRTRRRTFQVAKLYASHPYLV